MNLLFVADPLEIFKIYKDTTFSMMREAHRRLRAAGHGLAIRRRREGRRA
jgi:glutathione synthase